jgi:propanol-preferring alcohol dehydrogenase
VKDHGRVVLAGLGGEMLYIPPINFVYKSIELSSSLADSKAELERVLDLIADGSIAPALQEVGFEDLHGVFRLLESATLPKGRLFTKPKQFSSKI